MNRGSQAAVVIVVIAGAAVSTAARAQTAGPLRESRGVWLDKAQLVEGREALLARLDRLKAAGFNTVYVAVQVRGAVIYPNSRVLPQYEEARRKAPDLLDWLIPAIHQRAMHAEAWTEFGFYTFWTPDAAADRSRGPILDRRPELAARTRDGQDRIHHDKWGDFYSLCPSNPESQAVLADLYVETLDRYPFDGLSLDRIRYPDDRFCYCAYCTEQFRKDTGLELLRLPATRPADDPFVRWRKEQLTAFMKRFSSRFRERFPKARLTSAVVPPGLIDEKGQDWPTWVERGYLDAAMPMLYEADITQSIRWIRLRLGDKTAIFVGLDAAQGFQTLREQVAQLRALQAVGVTIWYSATVDPLLPDLRRDVFAVPAVSPLYPPER
jgi:uncharacterized lipoprotein YddW (UPF0748 family)